MIMLYLMIFITVITFGGVALAIIEISKELF